MKINVLFLATLAASAVAGPVNHVAERQIAPGIDDLLNGVTTVVSDLVHGVYDNLQGLLQDINIKSASIATTQQKVQNGEISKEDGEAKIQSVLKDIQGDFAEASEKLKENSSKLNLDG